VVARGIVQILCKLLQTILYTLQTFCKPLYSYTTTIVVRLEQATNSGAYTTTTHTTTVTLTVIKTTTIRTAHVQLNQKFCVEHFVLIDERTAGPS
jgi:hypothetical protein